MEVVKCIFHLFFFIFFHLLSISQSNTHNEYLVIFVKEVYRIITCADERCKGQTYYWAGQHSRMRAGCSTCCYSSPPRFLSEVLSHKAGKWLTWDWSPCLSDSRTVLPCCTWAVWASALPSAVVQQKENMKSTSLLMEIHKTILSFDLEAV